MVSVPSMTLSKGSTFQILLVIEIMLHLFVSCFPEVLEILLENGAQLDAPTACSKEAPLHIAVNYKSTDCARILIQRGCNLNIKVIQNSIPVG